MYGERLKKLRGKRSQEEVAEKVGISRARLSHYETERSQPDYDTLSRLADYYGVTIDYILGKSNDPRLTADEEKAVDKKVKELMEIIESMPEEKRNEMKEKILAYARGLADASKLDKN